MNEQLLCEECGKGHLQESTWEGDFRHGDGLVHVDRLECYVCDQCGADPVFTNQIRRNQLKIADAKRLADGLLTGADIHTLRQRLGLTQQEAAAVFGGGANAFSKYERGDVVQSVAMDRLLRLTGLAPFLLPVLRRMAGLETPATPDTPHYEQNVTISVNDASYRSRTVRGEVVVVDVPQWQRAA